MNVARRTNREANLKVAETGTSFKGPDNAQIATPITAVETDTA
jgi:hypothetical protein